MAFRPRANRRYRRKPIYRRKKMMKRTRARIPTLYSFKRKVVLGNIQAFNNGGTGTNAATAISFKLSDLPQYSDFTALFDQYKITGVKLDFIPFADNISWEVASMGPSIASPGGPLLLSVDYDDASAPTLASEMLSRQNVKVVPVGRRHRMYLKPKFVDIANGTTTTIRSGWIDCDAPNAVHYGIKAWMSAPNIPNSNFTYQVWATYYVSCKGVV